MKLLFDTNVITDFFFKRPKFFEDAQTLFLYAERGDISGFIAGHSITTIHYLLSSHRDRTLADSAIGLILRMYDVSTINRVTLQEAYGKKWADFEDAVVFQSALESRVDAIITRNIKDFKKSSVPIYTPKEIIKILENINDKTV